MKPKLLQNLGFDRQKHHESIITEQKTNYFNIELEWSSVYIKSVEDVIVENDTMIEVYQI
jgi:hypothetical protein